jgi:uncharacterized protein YcbX
MSIRLARIDVFPIKSLDAVSLTQARVLPSGCLENDRRYAIFDADGKVVNGKRTPLVHRLHASYSADFEIATFADRQSGAAETFSLSEDRREIDAFLSQHFGLDVALREDATAGFPDDTDASGPTFVSAETLAEVAAWFGIELDSSRQRFRANLTLEGGAPFWEDQLFGPPGDPVTFRVGELLFFGTNPCARCVVPSRDPNSGQQISGFARDFADRRRQNLPAWADIDAFDHFFRLAVNTRLFAPAEGGVLKVGDVVETLNK